MRAIFFRRGVRVPEFDLIISWPDLIRGHGMGVLDRPPEEWNRPEPRETFFLARIDGQTAVYESNGPEAQGTSLNQTSTCPLTSRGIQKARRQ